MANGSSTVSQEWVRKLMVDVRKSVFSENDNSLRVTYYRHGAPYGHDREEMVRWWEERIVAQLEGVHAKQALGLPWYEAWGLPESRIRKIKSRRRK